MPRASPLAALALLLLGGCRSDRDRFNALSRIPVGPGSRVRLLHADDPFSWQPSPVFFYAAFLDESDCRRAAAMIGPRGQRRSGYSFTIYDGFTQTTHGSYPIENALVFEEDRSPYGDSETYALDSAGCRLYLRFESKP